MHDIDTSENPHPSDARETWSDIPAQVTSELNLVFTLDVIARLVEWFAQNRSWAHEIDTA